MKQYIFCCILILAAGFGLFGGGSGEENKAIPFKEGDKITVKGFIKMVGNEPFTEMVIKSDETGQLFYLPAPFKKENRHLIASRVELEGIISIESLDSADHKYHITKVHLNEPVIKAP